MKTCNTGSHSLATDYSIPHQYIKCIKCWNTSNISSQNQLAQKTQHKGRATSNKPTQVFKNLVRVDDKLTCIQQSREKNENPKRHPLLAKPDMVCTISCAIWLVQPNEIAGQPPACYGCPLSYGKQFPRTDIRDTQVSRAEMPCTIGFNYPTSLDGAGLDQCIDCLTCTPVLISGLTSNATHAAKRVLLSTVQTCNAQA